MCLVYSYIWLDYIDSMSHVFQCQTLHFPTLPPTGKILFNQAAVSYVKLIHKTYCIWASKSYINDAYRFMYLLGTVLCTMAKYWQMYHCNGNVVFLSKGRKLPWYLKRNTRIITFEIADACDQLWHYMSVDISYMVSDWKLRPCYLHPILPICNIAMSVVIAIKLGMQDHEFISSFLHLRQVLNWK